MTAILNQLFPCACCGYLVHTRTGMADVCSVCDWKDGEAQLKDPHLENSLNQVSLWKAQRDIGKTPTGRSRLADARENKQRHSQWRPVNDDLDNFGTLEERSALRISNYSQLYYWAETFWNYRRRSSYTIDGPNSETAHSHAIFNRLQVEHSKTCGCFYCCTLLDSTEIEEWCDDELTPLCPYCGIDSVLAESSGYPLTVEFLTAMRNRWFS